MKKFMRIYLTVLCMVFMLNSIVLAGGATPSTSVEQLKGKLPVILNAIAWIGYEIAFGMFIFIGIKYTLSAANEKATLKQGSINFLIGGVLIASASVVADIVAGIAAGGGSLGSNSLATGLIDAAQNAAHFGGGTP